ncbi:MAG: P63C domain-containing protein [Acidobacteriaceae bacterium]
MSDLTSKAAKELSSKGAAKGGRARANVLSPDHRKEIARKAIATRWEKAGKGTSEQVSALPDHAPKSLENMDALPIALFPGKLKIGATEFSVYVLDNGKRVMAQREVVRVLTGNTKGGLDRYLETQNLRNYLDAKAIFAETERFQIPGTRYTGIGYEASLLVDICDAYLRAREDGALASNQIDLAKQAEIITRACAKIGIIALIDEATGYGAFKKKQEYQLKLQAFIAEDMQDWARMFPPEFWFELARLEGIHYSPRSRPLRWGRYIMAFVYDAIDGDVGKELRRKNPDPHFKQNHHQWLKEFGRQKVNDQIQRVVTIMKLCESMNDFRSKFAKVFKKTAITEQLNFGWGKE